MKALGLGLLLLLYSASSVWGGSSFSPCDINQDGVTNVADVQHLVDEVLGKSSAASGDLNQDGAVNVVDNQLVVMAVLNQGCHVGPPPSIAGFLPTSGPIGTLVTVTGSNFNSSVQVSMPMQGGGTIPQPISTSTAGSLTFVVAAGTATGAIAINNGAGVATSASAFTVTPSNSFSLSASPSSASLIRGQSVAYAVSLSSGNGFTGLASLSLSGAPAGVTTSIKPTSITAGQAAVVTLTAPTGQALATTSLSITAAATVEGISISQTAPLTLSVVAPTTSFIGRAVVSDTVETPLAGVTVSTMGLDGGGNTTGCTGHTTVSDAAGNFALTNLPSSCIGPQLISFNGNTVTSPPGTYAGVNLVFTLVSGQVVVSPVLVHMPRIDNVETFQVQQNAAADQTYVFKSIPGLQVTVYAGTSFSESDGSQPNPFPLAAIQVPVDRLPDQMPLTNSMVTPFIVAFQPANTTASKAVAVWFPNTLNTPPGADVPLMTLDPTRGRMVAYGTGTISNDGTTIIPDIDPSTGTLQHRFGIVHFDWHGPATNPPPAIGPTCHHANACTGDPVDLATGLQIESSTDMVLSGNRGPVSIVRTYRTLSTQILAFGVGAGLNYDYRLDSNSPNAPGVVNLKLPNGSVVPFNRQPDGTLVNSTLPDVQGAVLTTASDGTAALLFKSGEYITFQPGSGLSLSVSTSIGDSNGNVIQLVRNPAVPQQITEIDDAVGRKLTLTWQSVTGTFNGIATLANVITSITDPIGRSVSYTYNPDLTLATFTNVLGGVTRYAYDSLSRLKSVTDPRGIVLAQNTYDTNGRVATQTIPSGGVYRFAYTLTNGLVPTSPIVQTVVTDPLGNPTIYRFNTQGFVVSVTDATGQTRTLNRAPGTNLLVSETGGGTCGVCGDTTRGDMSYTYDAYGNMLTETDSLGNTTAFTYDPIFSRVTSVTDALGYVSKSSYDGHGNLIEFTDARGNVTTWTRNGNGLATAVQDPAGNITKMAYDSVGNLVAVTNPLNQITGMTYDAISRPIGLLDPLGTATSSAYNANGEVTASVAGNGAATQFAYDAAGFPLSFTDPKGYKTVIAYDTAGRPSSTTDPLNRAASLGYDLANNVTTATNRRGQQTKFTYDALNRRFSETYVDATVQNSYDAYGRVIRMVDSQAGIFNMAYDTAGRLAKTITPNGQIGQTLDADGRVTSRQVAGQPAATYTYDVNGNLIAAAMGSASTVRTYDARDLLFSNARSNGVTGSYTFDALGRLIGITDQVNSSTLFSRTLAYDATGQLTGVSADNGLPLSTPAATGAFDSANQVQSYGTTTYTSDADGNRLTETSSAGTTSYTWDARGRLQSVLAPGGVLTSFVYDPMGNMIQKHVASSSGDIVQRYILDDVSNIVSVQQDGGGVTSILDGRKPDDIVATVQGGSPVFPSVDQISSEAAFTDGSGKVIGREFYEPYGAPTGQGTASLFQFTGRLLVNAGLYYDRARFYDSATGRFLSPDPLGLAGGGANFYTYTMNSPVQFSDPSGKDMLSGALSALPPGTACPLPGVDPSAQQQQDQQQQMQQQMQQNLQFQQQMNQLTEQFTTLSSAQKASHDAIMAMLNNEK